MAKSFDTDTYMERIGYTGAMRPTLDTLRAIHRHHVEALPFENLNPLLRWPVRLDIDSLQEKMVRNGRGGYCYEHNVLLSHALQAIGFRVTGLAARVLSNRPPGDIPPRTHMLLKVAVGRTAYVADAGFGGMTLTEPIRLQAETVQQTSHEPRRLLQEGSEFVMQAKVRSEWRTLYSFNLEPRALADYEVANWYVSNYPDSHFIKRLTAARPTTDGRYALHNNELAVHDLEGNTKRTTLATAAELRSALEDLFLIKLPDSPELDTLLQRLTHGAEADVE